MSNISSSASRVKNGDRPHAPNCSCERCCARQWAELRRKGVDLPVLQVVDGTGPLPWQEPPTEEDKILDAVLDGSTDWRAAASKLNDFDARMASHKPPWWGDAVGDEVLAFNLSSVNPPDGSGVAGLDDRELRRQLATAANRLAAPSTATRWLKKYARKLANEAAAREPES